ncbi:MAG: aminotransferase class I/II-fold pyridoxal phosphate-dependent enzyme, partial [Novosphingobium sp.]
MTDRATALRAAGRDIISLSVGEPDFATPPHVVAAAKAALDAGETRYTPVGGTAALKRAAALHFARDLGIATERGQVTVSAGGKQAIFHALLATLDPGDEVLIPAPWWVSYPEIARFAGATVVALATDAAGGYRIGAAQLAAAITPRTRWLLLNSPGNPTGAVYSADELRALGEALRPHPRVLVLSDDIYAPLRYTPGAHATLAVECPDLAPRILTVSGVSKSHAMTGFRIGVAAGPGWLIAAMERLQSHSSGNPSSISQAAAVAAFTGPQDFLDGWRERFRARRDRVV